MKNNFFLVCVLCACASITFAQEIQDTIEVPNPARLSLYKDFPNVRKTQWIRESETVYRAEFVTYRDKNRYIAKYDIKGECLEKSIGIPYWQIPNEAKPEIAKRFVNFTPVSCCRFEMPGQKPVFRVTMEKAPAGDAPKETVSIEVSHKGELMKVSEQNQLAVSSDQLPVNSR